MGNMTITAELTSHSKTVMCEDTSELYVGLRVSGANYGLEVIIEKVINSSTFIVSEEAIEAGEYQLTLIQPAFTELVELQILCKLKEAIPDYQSELFPNSPSQYTLTHPNGAVLVNYNGSPFGVLGSGDRGSWSQERDLTFQIYVISRNLRGNAGIQRKLEEVRNALTTLIPTGCRTHLFQTDEGFIGEYGGEWHYGLWFKAKATFTIGWY